jgi:hypothetical protein
MYPAFDAYPKRKQQEIRQPRTTREKTCGFEKIVFLQTQGKKILKTRYYQISFAPLRGKVTASCKYVFSLS